MKKLSGMEKIFRKTSAHVGRTVTRARMLTVFSALLVLLSGIFATLAWFRSINNGEIEIPVDTKVNDGIVLAFTPFSELEGVLMPAEMKQGVINNELDTSSGYSSGSIEKITVPTGNDIFPKVEAVTDDDGIIEYYKYVIDSSDYGNLVPNNEYLKYPATSLYRQFSMNLGSSNKTITSRNANFSINLQYTDVSGTFVDLTQTDAFGFRFYLISEKLTSKELSSVSTDRFKSDLKTKAFKTWSELLYEHDSCKIYRVIQDGSNYYVKNAEKFVASSTSDNDGASSYVITPAINQNADGTFTLDFKLYDLMINTNYYLIVNLYYNLPDELLTGDLLLTDEIIMNITYSLENVVAS